MQDKGRIVVTGEVSDTPVIRATLQGLYTATFSLTSTTRRMNRAGVCTDRQKRHNIVARGDLRANHSAQSTEGEPGQHRGRVLSEAVDRKKIG